MRQVYHKRDTRRGLSDFAPQFEWDAPAKTSTNADPVEMLREACLSHLEAEGMICRQHFGVSLINCRRADGGPLTGMYKAAKYCDPLGALLDGTPFGAGILPDAMKLLGVDEFWLAGFVHGYDKTPGFWRGRNLDAFEESDSYKAGFKAGLEIGDEFALVELGWERQ